MTKRQKNKRIKGQEEKSTKGQSNSQKKSLKCGVASQGRGRSCSILFYILKVLKIVTVIHKMRLKT